MRIPRDIEMKVVAKLYADARELDWTSLTPQQHSAQYAKWVEDEEVGGRLREYLTHTDARVWIKDGPMKEWSRALSGVGKYSALIDDSDDVPTKLVHKALGPDWTVDKATIATKPLRVVARRGAEEAVVTWSGSRDFKHLVWAALTASAEGDDRQWTVCVLETFTKPVPKNEKQAHQRLATRCDLAVQHISV
jgi:hypothetical protein